MTPKSTLIHLISWGQNILRVLVIVAAVLAEVALLTVAFAPLA